MHNDNELKRFTRKVARKLGIQWLTDWEIRVRRDAELTEKLLQSCLKEDSCCVDIGANKGDFLELFTTLSPKGKHFAFEPIPAHAKSLAKRFTDVEVYDCALSNREGEVSFFHVEYRDAWSGLRKQNYPDGATPIEITVHLKRLDDVIGADVNVDFIKIDVEGAEYEVLQGAKETLTRCRPTLLFEHAKLHNEHYSTTPEMVFDLINGECGMTIYDLAMSREFNKDAFIDIYEQSFTSNYDRSAQTNFVARYTS